MGPDERTTHSPGGRIKNDGRASRTTSSKDSGQEERSDDLQEKIGTGNHDNDKLSDWVKKIKALEELMEQETDNEATEGPS